MSDQTATGSAALPLPLLRLANRLCDRFEAAWKASRRPRPEDYVADLAGPDRAAVLRQLVPLDVDYRRLAGEHPGRSEYLARFPELDAAWLAGLLGAPEPPRSLGEYDLLDHVADGGMGRVYRARHRRMDRIVALKLLEAGHADPDRVRRFQRETETAARLSHPHIVTAFDAGQDGPWLYLVTEFVDGVDLARLVRDEGPLPVDRAVDCLAQAARGLEYAHGKGVIHRDVKPSNLLLGRDGVVRVADFGLARARAAGASSGLTHTGMVMGTVDYMAPEQGGDPRRADERSDVYGLGCTLHYLLTGRPPYEGETATDRPAPLPSLRTRRPDVPAALDAVFQKMIVRDPAGRQQSMAEVLSDLACPGRSSRGPLLTRRRALVALGAGMAMAGGVWLWPRRSRKPATVERLPLADPAAYQRAWAEELGVPIEIRTHTGLAMRLVPPGVYLMGSSPEEIDSRLRPGLPPDIAENLRSERQREVTIEGAFYLGVTEVTRGQFARFVDDTGHRTWAEEHGNGYGRADGEWRPIPGCSWRQAGEQVLVDEHPVFNLVPADAEAFCRWLRATAPEPLAYRLPAETEWEWACRAGGPGRWHFGDDRDFLDRYAWYEGNSGGLVRPAGGKEPNPFGLYDMLGNVAEWCPGGGDRPLPFKAKVPLRGGKGNDGPRDVRSASRFLATADDPLGGFRVFRELPGQGFV